MPRSYTTHAKHASIVPQAATVFEELVAAAGAPKGAWTNIFASGEQIAALIADDRVHGATLTGSEKARGIVATEASKSLKKSVANSAAPTSSWCLTMPTSTRQSRWLQPR